MPTSFNQAIESGIGTTPVTLLEVPTGFKVTVIGCNLTNITEYDNAIVDVQITTEGSSYAYYAKGIVIPPNTSLKLVTNGEKLILPQGGGIRVSSDIDGSIDAVVSYVELS
jgi:hypothetical protein